MARVYKIGRCGKTLTGKELIKEAGKIYDEEIEDNHIAGLPCSKHTTVNGCINWLIWMGRDIYTRRESELVWSKF